MSVALPGFTPYDPADAAQYQKYRWWPGLTLGDLLDKAADIYPDREAFVDGRSRLTYGEAREQVNRLALGLLRLGIQPLERILVQLPNWNEFVLSYFALQKIGAIPVLLLDRHRQHEIGHLVGLAGATGWIVAESHRNVDYLPIVADVKGAHPGLRHVILARGSAGAYPSLSGLTVEEEISAADRAALAGRRPDPAQVGHMAPTGGTTGLPKLVPRTHESLVCGSEYAARAWDYDGRDTCLLAGPMGHDLTFTKGLLGGLFTYARLVLLDSTDLGDVCRTIERERVTAIVWVPTLANRLIHYEDRGRYDLSSLEKMHSGGGASLPDLIRSVREKLGCTYYNGYGGTEGQTTISRRSDDLETVCNTVGKPTCPYDRYRVIDQDGRELPVGSSGELVIKGPGVFTGYYGNPQENALAFTRDGFFRTGDLARIDERGYVTLTGRAKEMINRGGESISAVEIERLISDHPEVVSVAVVPMPDPDLGERVCAYVQTTPGAALTFTDVIAFLRGRKAAVLHLPERIEFVNELPQTKTGKIDKATLKDDIARKLGK
ncbi:MAG: AMP-binding protein [Deltaproteobacteria bacterium]|nr:AMP-binding protein [Deltaproteobacteria bacterium]